MKIIRSAFKGWFRGIAAAAAAAAWIAAPVQASAASEPAAAAAVYAAGGAYAADSFEEAGSIVYGVMKQAYGTSVTVNYTGDTSDLAKQLDKLFKQVGSKDDYMRFVLKKMSWSWTSTRNLASITFKMEYWETAEQSEYVRKTAKEAVDSLVKPGMTDRQLVKAIHDWVIGRFAYDYSLSSHSAYDGLAKGGSTVCQGYALMTQRMLEAAGFDSRIVYGDSKGSKHVWNLVKLGDSWLHLDTTLDEGGAAKPGTAYLLVSDDAISKDHSWVRSEYPAARG